MLLFYLSSMLFFLISMLSLNLSLIFMILKKKILIEWNFLTLNSFMMNFLIYLDWISLMFMFSILLISSMILIYSSEYLHSDNHKNRFFYLMILFIFSMLLMIFSPNIISILVGWDSLGLISYCLIIYYQNISSYNSGMLTILMNRMGDIFMLISISLFISLGSWNFLSMNYLNLLILIFIVLSSFTKSAQLPFSSWLLAAMVAPTPISALVHSSTLVTAGVYLLIRFNFLIFKNDKILYFIMIMSIFTMLLSGISANMEFDIKKIIAYSTLSQLSMMMMILSFKNYELTFFHLINHAIFKSMMFMCAGIIIHNMNNYQDIRYMSSIIYFMPFTSIIFLISNLSLCGMPFFSGFYSKDLIFETMLYKNFNFLCLTFMMLNTGLTISYSLRLTYFLINKFYSPNLMLNFKKNDMMNKSMLLLFLLSMKFGYMMNWLMFSMINEINLLLTEKILILLISFMFMFTKHLNKLKMNKNFLFFYYNFFNSNWFLNNMIYLMIKVYFNSSLSMIKILEKGWNEYFFMNSLNLILKKNFWILKFKNIFLMNLIMMMNYIMIIIILFK